MFAFCKKAYIRCLEEIKLRNIGGMILIDFPRMSSTKKKILHEKTEELKKFNFDFFKTPKDTLKKYKELKK